MTEEENIIERMCKIFYVWKTSPEDRQESWNNLARWHLSELKKAELRARIEELNNAYASEGYFDKRITDLQSELSKLEEGQ